MTLYKLFKELKNDKIKEHLEDKHRLIAPGLYNELKHRTKCMRCKKKFKKLQIHHVQPVRYLGSNLKENLRTLCPGCHDIENKESEELYGPKESNKNM